MHNFSGERGRSLPHGQHSHEHSPEHDRLRLKLRREIEQRLRSLHMMNGATSVEYRWDADIGQLMGLWADWVENGMTHEDAGAKVLDAVQRIERVAQEIRAGTGHIGRAVHGILNDVATDSLQLPISGLDDLLIDPKEQRRREREDEEAIRDRTRAGMKEAAARSSQVKRSGHAAARVLKRF
ncbi:TPA: hypothetical protein DCL30_02715 [Candidatus Peribacteria bacterium]|nr:MAG: hypothetical protein A3J91_03715 [Candidatus Peribacteria bacterium RIFOXYC2_FULL_58_10]OGJ84306.1 MAG: hypothetical protein A2529_02975 [Candidatus Peribacteria bacterium RIFOXYD2_FULL_58_15]HAI98433.1 hypothetical protein [Candidatus Peribacteria bacterium]HAS34018.1 hypothetical protein [Candidatus Peribacteria bacterium]